MKKYQLLLVISAAALLTACEADYLSVEDTATITADRYRELIASDPSTLQNSVNGLYTTMYWEYSSANHDEIGIGSILHATDMMTEDIVQTKEHWFTYDYQLEFRMNNYRRPYSVWTIFYTMINNANGVIALVDLDIANGDATTSTAKTLRSCYGQALGIRALSYMYLIQIFQNPFTAAPTAAGASIDRSKLGVPLYFASNETDKESNYSRNTVGAVLDVIEADLLKAEKMLEGVKRSNKVQIDKSVIEGLLARYYLLVGNWSKAAEHAQLAYAGYTIMEEAELVSGGFIDLESKEWMWGFDVTTETSLIYASWYSHISNLAPGYAGGGYAPRAIDKRLYEQIPETDFRKRWFNDSKGDKTQSQPGAQGAYANVKFGWDGTWTMDNPYMRAAEMYLIEAEAKARQGNETGAAEALKPLMAKRDTAWNATSVTVEDVLLQRRIELWGEGFAYFDLKRNYRGIDRTYDGSNHRKPDGFIKVDAGDVRWTYQIPLSELQENTEITDNDQNP